MATFGVDAFNNWNDAYTNVDAGGTIECYPSNIDIGAMFTIAKSITVNGPQANVDPRPSFGSARTVGGADEAIFRITANATLFRVAADDVTFNGVSFMPSGAHSVDLLDSNSTINDVAFRYCIISDAGDEGMQIREATGVVIEYNYVYSVAQDGINVCCGSSVVTCQYNELFQSGGTNGAIYMYEGTGAADVDTDVRYNLIQQAGTQGIDLGSGATGMAKSNARVTGNIIITTGGAGIEMQYDGVTVTGNHVEDVNGGYGGIAFRQVAAIGRSAQYNNVTDCTSPAFNTRDGAGNTGQESLVTIENNDIWDNGGNGAENPNTGTITYGANYWGAADGPSGGGVVGSGETITGNVDATAFSATPLLTYDVSDTTHDFGGIDLNTTTSFMWTVSPTTTAMVIDSPGVNFSGTDAGKFSVVSSHTFPIYLFPNGTDSVTFEIEYAPGPDPGPHTATGEVVSRMVADRTVALTGTAPPPPTLDGITISDADGMNDPLAGFANDATVTVTLGTVGGDATTVEISEDGTFMSGVTSAAYAMQATESFTLSGGDGDYIVWARLLGPGGNSTPTSNSITLDTTAPGEEAGGELTSVGGTLTIDAVNVDFTIEFNEGINTFDGGSSTSGLTPDAVDLSASTVDTAGLSVSVMSARGLAGPFTINVSGTVPATGDLTVGFVDGSIVDDAGNAIPTGTLSGINESVTLSAPSSISDWSVLD